MVVHLLGQQLTCGKQPSCRPRGDKSRGIVPALRESPMHVPAPAVVRGHLNDILSKG